MNQYELLKLVETLASDYLSGISAREVFPSKKSLEKLEDLRSDLPENPVDAEMVIRQLHEVGKHTTVASNAGRYFGYIFGGALPASLAASWLSSSWDQNAAFRISSPISAHLESISAKWLLQLFKLPASSAVGFVTGTTMGNFTAVIAARHHLLKQKGWNSKSKGFNGAPEIKVVVGEEVHASMQRALMLAGFGLDQLIKVPTDDQGRMIAEQLPELDVLTLICVQCGNVNTGSIDPLPKIIQKAKNTGAWVHVDGAFGLWSRVSPSRQWMAEGIEQADSWAVDLHKWLNVPYDSGLVICKNATALQDALAVTAAYLPDSPNPEPYFHTPEMSRKARGIETWAALHSLGKSGVADLIDRCSDLALLFAVKLKKAGFEILNEVVLNQVLVSFGDDETNAIMIKRIQEDGTCWAGGTTWKGRSAMRISVSSWATTALDIDKSSEAIIRIAKQLSEEKK